MLDNLVVEASRPKDAQLDILDGDALRLRAASTLGKTLEREPGVNNLSYGPGVGQPVIRGLSGPRVRVMQGGMGVHDASTMSPDHAIATESLLADRITIERGPATLRYGGSAVGGAVNIEHQRIPDKIPENGIEGRTEYRFDHNSDEHAGMVGVDLGRDRVAVHLDYFQRGNQDMRIPGTALDESAIIEQFRIRPERNRSGKVENTDGDSQGGSAGIAWIGEQGRIGVGYYQMAKDYGVPPGVPGHGHADVDGTGARGESVRVDMEQQRYELEAELFAPFPIIDKVVGKLSYSDYRHDEIDRGQPFTRFDNEVLESRVEVEHGLAEWLTGRAGFQWQDRDFSAVGVETFVPASAIDNLGIFLTEAVEPMDGVKLEFGLRQEWQHTVPEARTLAVPGIRGAAPLPKQLSHSPFSIAAGLELTPIDGGVVYFSWQRGQRAPEVQELLSAGPHLATRTFEIGRLDLNNETSWHHELGLRFDNALWSLDASAFWKPVDNYIVLENQGFFFNFAPDPPRPQADCANLQSCLPVFAYQGRDANFWGYEANISLHPDYAWGSPHLTLFSDFVRGYFKESGAGDVPRLPPLRFGFEVGLQRGGWQSALRYTRALRQHRPGLNETETPAYDRLDLDIAYTLDWTDGKTLMVFGKASNIGDSAIRNATSFLRSFAPEAGLSLQAGFRAQF